MFFYIEWAPGKDDEKETRGDKPPKGKKEKKPKKTKKDRANPDFEDIPGYGGNAFHGDSRCFSFHRQLHPYTASLALYIRS